MLVHSIQRLVTTEIWNIVMGVKDKADEVQAEADEGPTRNKSHTYIQYV
jgi:hypothetical protein